jgi:hypothetical protein
VWACGEEVTEEDGDIYGQSSVGVSHLDGRHVGGGD